MTYLLIALKVCCVAVIVLGAVAFAAAICGGRKRTPVLRTYTPEEEYEREQWAKAEESEGV